MKQITKLLFLSIALIHFSCGEQPQRTFGWEALTLSQHGIVQTQGIVGNNEGVLLAFGYDDETYHCGFLWLGNCKKLKTYRSFDKGETWEEITNYKISKLHGIIKGDKISPALIRKLSKQYGTHLYIGKKIIDVVAYSEYRSKGRYISDGENFYIYLDYIWYTSSDNGDNWTEIEVEDNFSFYDYNQSTIEIVDDYLVAHEVDTYKKYVFKREGNKFKKYSDNKFAIKYEDGAKELMFSDGRNLAANYQFKADRAQTLAISETDDSTYTTAEFYQFKNTLIANAIIPNEGYPIYFGGISNNNGKYFVPAKIKEGILNGTRIDGFKVIGEKGEHPIIKAFFFVAKGQIQNKYGVSLGVYYRWDPKKEKLVNIRTPDTYGLVHGFKVVGDYYYYFNENGLYRLASTEDLQNL